MRFAHLTSKVQNFPIYLQLKILLPISHSARFCYIPLLDSWAPHREMTNMPFYPHVKTQRRPRPSPRLPRSKKKESPAASLPGYHPTLALPACPCPAHLHRGRPGGPHSRQPTAPLLPVAAAHETRAARRAPPPRRGRLGGQGDGRTCQALRPRVRHTRATLACVPRPAPSHLHHARLTTPTLPPSERLHASKPPPSFAEQRNSVSPLFLGCHAASQKSIGFPPSRVDCSCVVLLYYTAGLPRPSSRPADRRRRLPPMT
jgi:hypothetical protein